jgi:hypothetical protein
MEDNFVLLKDIGELKKGKKFESFGGLVSAVVVDMGDSKEQTIRFDNKEWFKLIKKKIDYETRN